MTEHHELYTEGICLDLSHKGVGELIEIADLEQALRAANAEFFAPVIEDTEHLLVSTLNLYEVFKRVYQQRGENEALQAVAAMMQATVVDVTPSLAVDAAKISLDLRLPMADSLILTTARAHNAALWTQDIDLANVEGVHFITKQ